jgi:wobble nucleotide-excising tRNase
MIKKIITIKNVGRYKDYNCSGDLELRKMNIIYGENGAGKTTLVTILRSLRDNNKNILFGRKTLGVTGEQQILILTEPEGQIKFNKVGWDKNLKNIEIFDSKYIMENVHSGNYVDIEHKRNLHIWAIGEEGVKLANRIAEIDNETRDLTTNKIRETENRLKSIIKGNLPIEDFILLKQDSEINTKIKEQEIIFESSKNIELIKAQALPEEIKLFELPIDQLKGVFNKSYQDITEEIAKKVSDHITENLDEKGGAWIEKGLDYVRDNSCPFCTQDLMGIDLISYYKEYFNVSYKLYKDSIIETLQRLKRTTNQNYFDLLDNRIKLNQERLLNWNNHLKFENKLPEIDSNNYSKVIDELISEVNRLIDQKTLNPIEQLDLMNFDQSNNKLLPHTDQLSVYNQSVKTINASIEQFKTKLRGDVSAEQRALDKLLNTQIRFKDATVKLVEDWQNFHSTKAQLNQEKTDCKDQLNKITRNILDKYRDGINNYLSNCGANFTLCNTDVKYPGGKASIDYEIEVNQTSISLGKVDSPDDIPSFKNTLSEGDKSALAFAFFLAKIETDPELNKKIVIIDDPISSMDVHRKDTTAYSLYKISHGALQTLIFTHALEFAKLVWEKDKSSDKKCLRTEIENDGCKIIEFDVDKMGMSDYFHHYFLISEFITSGRGDKKSIAQSIRPLLEGNLRFRFPKSFKNDQWLGNYLDLIRGSLSGTEIYILLSQLTELEEINEYSKKFHHDQDDKWSENLSNINSTSLKAYSERALKFCTG